MAEPVGDPGPLDFTAAPDRRTLWVVLALSSMLVVDQARFVLQFLRIYSNEDVTLMWYSARDMGAFRFFQPNYYGQSYFTVYESFAAVPFQWLGFGENTAAAAATAVFMVAGWFFVAAAAIHRKLRVSAVAAVALPLSMSSIYLVVNEAPGGHGAGSLVVFVAAGLLTLRPSGRVVDPVIVSLLGLGLLWNYGMLPAAVVVGAGMLPRLSSIRRAAFTGGVGAIVPIAWFLGVRQFYNDNSDYNLHRSAAYQVDGHRLWLNVLHPSRYLEAMAFTIGGGWLITIALALALLVAALRTRRLHIVVAAIGLVCSSLFIISLNKSIEGANTPYFSFGRFLVAAPLAVWVLLAMIEANGWQPFPVWVNRRRLAMAVVIVALASFARRQIDFGGEYRPITADAADAPIAPVVKSVDIVAQCHQLEQLADDQSVSMIVFRTNRIAAYGCGAVWYDHIQTLFPEYDRRTWLVIDAQHDRRSRLLVYGADEPWCASVIADTIHTCEMLGDGETAVVTTDPQSTWATADALGITLRPVRAA